GLLHYIDGSECEPTDPILDQSVDLNMWTPAEAALDITYRSEMKTWQQGEAIVKQQIAGTIPDSLFMKICGQATAHLIWKALAGNFEKKSRMVSIDL
ncbi:hypothetical protein BDZ94DRAFT_1148665, partial [Collybia nuda]